MKLTESKLIGLIKECLYEVLQERNAQEKGMSDDEVVSHRIRREKDNMFNKFKTGEPGLDADTKKYIDSHQDKDWDWHRLFKHNMANDHLKGHNGGSAEDRYAKRYGEKIESGDLNEGVNNNPKYNYYMVNKKPEK